MVEHTQLARPAGREEARTCYSRLLGLPEILSLQRSSEAAVRGSKVIGSRYNLAWRQNCGQRERLIADGVGGSPDSSTPSPRSCLR